MPPKSTAEQLMAEDGYLIINQFEQIFMKRLTFIAGISAIIAMSACTNTTTDKITNAVAADSCAGRAFPYPALYQGTFPAADSEGAKYNLVVEQGKCGVGVYALRTDYIGAPKPGDVYLDSGTVSRTTVDSIAVMKLNSVVPGNEPMNFKINRDGSLTMLTSDMQEAPSGLSYKLEKVL